jgi:hypothetical protein
MGLISRSANAAAWKTVLFAILLPWLVLVCLFVPIFLLVIPKLIQNAAWTDFVTAALPAAGSLVIDLWLYRFARRKLHSQLRQRASLAPGGH